MSQQGVVFVCERYEWILARENMVAELNTSTHANQNIIYHDSCFSREKKPPFQISMP